MSANWWEVDAPAQPAQQAGGDWWAQDEPVRAFDPMNDAPRLPGEAGFQSAPSAPRRGSVLDVAMDTAKTVGGGIVGTTLGGLNALGQLAVNALPFNIPGIPKADPADAVRVYQEAFGYQPETRQLASAIEAVEPVLSLPRKGGERSGEAYLDLTGSPLVATAAHTLVEGAPDILGLKGARATRAARAPVTPKASAAAIPGAEELAEASSRLYTAADQAGVVIHPKSTARAANMIRQVAEKENLGRLPPKIAEAVSILDERVAQNRPLTLMEADKVRQIIGDAFASSDATDRRLAAIIRERYDNDYLGKLGPQDTLAGNAAEALKILESARNLYRRKSNAELIDRAIHEAERKGDVNYSQAGKEHALRREFEAIARNKKLMRTFSPEQREAIEQVARGGKITNALRNLGKFDPAKGGMAAALGGLVGGGAGATLGGLVGGLSGGSLGATLGTAGLYGAAHLAARGALRRTTSNVERAREALVGRGLPEVDDVAASGQNLFAQLARQREIDDAGAAFDAERASAAEAARRSIEVQELPAQEVVLATPPQVAAQIPSTREVRNALARLAEPIEAETQLRNAAKSAVAVKSERPAKNRLSQLGGERTIEQIEAELKKLGERAQRLPPDEPFDSPRMQAIEREYSALRKELEAARAKVRRAS